MVTAALVTGFAPAASAAVIGTLALSPTSGDGFTAINATASTSCPAEASNFQTRFTSGPAGTNITAGAPVAVNGNAGLDSVSATPGDGNPWSFPVAKVLNAVRTTAGLSSLPVGDYTFLAFCRTKGSSVSLGDFEATITVTTPITDSAGAWNQKLPSAATTTELTASPDGTAVAGATVTLTATVANTDAPATKPTGTVQFKDGDANIGDPVAVTDGVATKPVTTLTAGVHSLSAVYLPGSADFLTSSSLGVSYAITGGVIGTLALSPTSGDGFTAINATASTSCPASATNFQTRVISGPAGTNITTATPVAVNGNAALESVSAIPGDGNPWTFPVAKVLNAVRTTAGLSSLPVGDYVFLAFCRSKGSSLSLGDFKATIRVTTAINDSAGAWNYVVPTDATTTTLTASPVDTAAFGANVTLTATVADTDKPDTKPAGTVQFKDGATNLGAAVALVDGVATTSLTNLPVGARSLTAVYVPSAGFEASTSAAVGYTITAVTPVNTASPKVTGTAKVGSTLTCSNGTWTPAGATFTRVWTRNGANISGAAATTYKLTVSDYTKSVACKVTAKIGTLTESKSSASVKVAAGAAPTAKVRAKIVGSVKVGTTLKASATWSPTASYALTYVWKLSGKVISTKSTYKPAKSAKGKSLTVTITAKRTGYAAGTSTSLAAKVK